MGVNDTSQYTLQRESAKKKEKTLMDADEIN